MEQHKENAPEGLSLLLQAPIARKSSFHIDPTVQKVIQHVPHAMFYPWGARGSCNACLNLLLPTDFSWTKWLSTSNKQKKVFSDVEVSAGNFTK